MACLLCFGFWRFGHGAYIPATAWLAQELMQRAWARTGRGETRTILWPWGDMRPVARLTARSGEVDLIVLAGGDGRTLAFGPGHLNVSAMPGKTGNTVIAGHRDTHFQFLQDVQRGELFSIESNEGLKHLYKVVAIDIVDSQKGRLLLDTDAAILSLVTCYPFDTTEADGSLRYVVTARMLF